MSTDSPNVVALFGAHRGDARQLKALLAKAEFQLVALHSESALFDLLATRPPAALIVEVIPGDVQRLAVCKRIKVHHGESAPPIIVLAVMSITQHTIHLSETTHTVDAWVEWPVGDFEFVTLLRKLIASPAKSQPPAGESEEKGVEVEAPPELPAEAAGRTVDKVDKKVDRGEGLGGWLVNGFRFLAAVSLAGVLLAAGLSLLRG